jgi:hypothetical protein
VIATMVTFRLLSAIILCMNVSALDPLEKKDGTIFAAAVGDIVPEVCFCQLPCSVSALRRPGPMNAIGQCIIHGSRGRIFTYSEETRKARSFQDYANQVHPKARGL